jgi:hypothetical protein
MGHESCQDWDRKYMDAMGIIFLFLEITWKPADWIILNLF